MSETKIVSATQTTEEYFTYERFEAFVANKCVKIFFGKQLCQ
jgi:hypothetical protein